MLKHLSIACVIAAATSSSHAALIADSIADFSAIQGQNGWFYGYFDIGSPLAATFQPMTEFDGSRWWVDSTRYWTMIGPAGAHANGMITSGHAVPDEQWAARRWVSSINALVDVDTVFAKLNVNPASNGVTGRIFVDGAEIWNQTISSTDSTGVTPSFQLNVVPGTTIDFILDPHDSNDWSDNTQFSATVTTVPAPAVTSLLGLAGAVAVRRRRTV